MKVKHLILIIVAILDVVSFTIDWHELSIISILCGLLWSFTLVTILFFVIENWNKKIF